MFINKYFLLHNKKQVNYRFVNIQCCNKNDCIATCKKTKNFKANKTQKLYVPSELKLSSDQITTYNDQKSSEKVEEIKETIKEQ